MESKFFESKFMKGLQHFGETMGNNKAFSSISGGMMSNMAVILVGCIFQIVATIPTLFGWITTQSPFYQMMMVPYNMTMGIISVITAFSLAFNYAKKLDMKPLQSGIGSMVLFIMVAAPAQTLALADGSFVQALNTGSLGGVGLFTAILIGLVSVRITWLFQKYKITIKMPDVVPQFLADSFSALIPFLANVVVWFGLNSLLASTMSTTLPMAITTILSRPLMALNSVPGMLLIGVFSCVLWLFGIHGSMVGYIATMPLVIQCITANGAAVAAGGQAIFYPVFLFAALSCAGGTGNTLALVILGLRSKSEQIRAVSKAAIVPGLFNINEPATFGFPIMYNPVLAIPYILTPVFTMLLVWGGYMIGFFHAPYIMIMSLMPIGMIEFLQTLSWQNLLIPVVGLAVGFALYFPFLKAYESDLVKKEAAIKAAAKSE